MCEFQKVNPALSQTMETHLIDDLEKFGVWTDDYDNFLHARASLVSAELKKKIIERRSDSFGQPIKSDDIEEEMAAFE